MKYLAIRNNGELDPRLISLMGGSTKAGKSTIGQFGTGLKYTLAYLFRNNLDFGLFVGENGIPITTTKYGDCSREFQQHWIDMYVKEMMKRGDIKL